MMAVTKFSRFQRLQMLGPSLPAILIGGLILILVGINGLFGRKAKGELGSTRQAGQIRFSVGHEWGLQTWIAIVGVAFALLSFGVSEAYVHLFDTWSSRQAKHGNGLDYARYLNSQPRAPVIYGLRGFPAFITLRYFLVIIGIVSSIGYKFAIVSPDAWIKENLDPDKITFSGTQLSAVRSESEPWIIDLPFLDGNRAFLHHSQFSKDDSFPTNTLPPLGIVMVGHASCYRANYKRGGLFYPADVGTLFTRELALMANG
ncbi:hypothetical protein F53441_11253 [Fusarium austroafricanum]|uniref:Uncharacterized protein n=1 Tax=Fusarium austroafricanum TaxID=2364996 RepID=A0A8H4K618_9HYPO|nr:hypothetical protein F53441_11253 [Fusarium austroafricanum]